ncbi:hypothetical protein JKA74_04395 [Marivirga sp. S37H4]|uniref:Uncharacterized protein n=1 Tax=Marivirga aurantiaca TaxID=2802615 RepID=A0A935C661_9BACT|nr:hypothetical protein [Marivirga aurantiaca]MBK6264266.1 hypothetical protein [Marivirga aurantiaca]
MIRLRLFVIVFLLTMPSILPAQIRQGGGSGMDETELYASTKQVNQFFRRFNGEEDQKGKRYYQNDRAYRDVSLRKNYITILFDDDNSGIPNDRKKAFINDVTDKRNPKYLNFHDDGWFAEVSAVFTRSGQEENISLFFKIQPQGQGFEWVLDKATSMQYQQYFGKDSSDQKSFLHPMSHELDFMNLHKSFRNQKGVDFTSTEFKPDYLSIFLYELGNKTIAFKTVKNLKFHFFQCEGWYFQISEYNRPGYNSGWLISDLAPIKNEDISALKAFIYDQQ